VNRMRSTAFPDAVAVEKAVDQQATHGISLTSNTRVVIPP
jgi:hypothetical protein